MINWTDTNHLWSHTRTILKASIPLASEGMAMVNGFEGGQNVAQISTGSTSDAFLGILMGPRKPFGSNYRIENVVVPATGPYTVLLGRTVTGFPGAFSSAGALVASSAGAASTTNVQSTVDPTTGLTLLTFDSSFAGQAFSIGYNYQMSALENMSEFGGPPGGLYGIDFLGLNPLFYEGRIAVNNVDPKANWYAGGGSGQVKVIAGGLFTDAANAATGVIPSNIRIEYIPTAARPWLCLNCR